MGQQDGLFDSEIVPVATKVKDKEGKEAEVVIAKDEGPRAGTTAEGLAKLKPAFKKDGSTTAGNSSQVSDGASLVLLARRSAAKQLKLPILARMRSFAVVGVEPHLMGIGPAFAIPAALEKANLKVDDIDSHSGESQGWGHCSRASLGLYGISTNSNPDPRVEAH